MKVIYEAIFLDNEEIRSLFAEVRGPEAPYPKMTQDFHVTTAFRPHQPLQSLYGAEVTVHITAYQRGEITAESGESTENEGFFCSVTAENSALREIFSASDRKWHITGSYRDAAKYTELLELTGARAVDYKVRGRFGGYLSDGSLALTPRPKKAPGKTTNEIR